MTIPHEIFVTWKEDLKQFDGDIALFWAGKMSTVTSFIVGGGVTNLSSNIQLLKSCKDAYDNEIFSRCK